MSNQFGAFDFDNNAIYSAILQATLPLPFDCRAYMGVTDAKFTIFVSGVADVPQNGLNRGAIPLW